MLWGGIFYALVEAPLVTPLDTFVVHTQATNLPLGESYRVLRSGKRFFTSLPVTMVSSMPRTLIHAGVYTTFRSLYQRLPNTTNAVSQLALNAASLAVETALTSPFSYLETQLRLTKPVSTWRHVGTLLLTDGIRSFFSAALPSTMRDVVVRLSVPYALNRYLPLESPTMAKPLALGFASGALAYLASYPFDLWRIARESHTALPSLRAPVHLVALPWGCFRIGMGGMAMAFTRIRAAAFQRELEKRVKDRKLELDAAEKRGMNRKVDMITQVQKAKAAKKKGAEQKPKLL